MVSAGTRNTGVVRSNRARVEINVPLVEESNGKSAHKVHLRKKNSETCFWFLLRLKSSMQRIWKAGSNVEIYFYTT